MSFAFDSLKKWCKTGAKTECRKSLVFNNLSRMDSNHDKVIQSQWWERQSWRRGGKSIGGKPRC
jgi:hypothetical protein